MSDAIQGFGLVDGARLKGLAVERERRSEARIIADGDADLEAAILDGRAEKYRDPDGNLKARMKGTGPHDY